MKAHRRLYSLSIAACIAATLLGVQEVQAQGRNDDVADLSVDIVRGPRRIEEGDRVRYIVRVENDGPDDAWNVEVSARVSRGLELTGVRCRGFEFGDDTCLIRRLREGRSAFVVFEVEADDSGRRRRNDEVLRVRVDADQFDFDRRNNRDRISIEVEDDRSGRRFSVADAEVNEGASAEAAADLNAAEASAHDLDTEVAPADPVAMGLLDERGPPEQPGTMATHPPLDGSAPAPAMTD